MDMLHEVQPTQASNGKLPAWFATPLWCNDTSIVNRCRIALRKFLCPQAHFTQTVSELGPPRHYDSNFYEAAHKLIKVQYRCATSTRDPQLWILVGLRDGQLDNLQIAENHCERKTVLVQHHDN